MSLAKHATFSCALITAALSVVSFSLLYVFMSLAHLSTLLTVLMPESPDHALNAVQQFVASISHELIGGETPKFMSQSAFAVAALLFCLVVLLTLVEEALLRAKEKVRAWGKLPSVEVLHHYNNNSYDAALARVGRGLVTKKQM